MHVSTYLHCKRLQWTLLTKSRNTVDRGLNRFLLWFSNVEFLVWHSLRNDSLNKVHKDWWYENPRKQLWCESTSLGVLRGWSRSQPKAFPDSTEGLTRDAFIITILVHLFILVTIDWQNQLQKKKKSDTNECIYKTETDLQILKTNLWFPKWKCGWGRDKLGLWD